MKNLYSQMLEAYERVCRRLGKPGTEDEDVEIIISNLMSIGRHQSMKSLTMGAFYRKRNKQYVTVKWCGCDWMAAPFFGYNRM